VAWVLVNMESSSAWQAQTDTYARNNAVRICVDDYTSTNNTVVNRYAARSLFVSPTGANPDPRPVFIAINCMTNSPSHAYRQLLVKDFYAGGGAQDFTAQVNQWRNTIDSVQAPPPKLTKPAYSANNFEFTFPGQRGRTNRVQSSSDLVNWTTITNFFGTNAPIVVRDTNAVVNDRRFYRVVRF